MTAVPSITTRRLWEWPWQWVARWIPDPIERVFLPVGTMEAHGIIPLGTDTLIPLALAEALAEPLNAVIAPPIYYGRTSSLRQYPGSMDLPATLFRDHLQYILRELVRVGFRQIVVFNGHGGQSDEVRTAARSVHIATGVKIATLQWWELLETAADALPRVPGGHGGNAETALVQAIRREWCHPELLPEAELAPLQKGLQAYPFPGTVMQLGGERLEPLPHRDARAFFELTCQTVRTALETVFAGWSRMPSPDPPPGAP